MTKLKLAPGLTLPLDAVTQRFAFLGRIGSGKTYAETKLAELMLEAGAQVIAIDPVGKFYGLRVPGKGAAFDIPIFGGLHGDVPLEATGGALIADLIVDRTISCIIDVSQFETDAAKAKFAAAFAERFYFRKKSSPSAVHVFLEECQEFVPQNTAKGEEMMLHHWTRMAKLGRNFGIGLSLASQRPQEVNKKVLNLTECLFAFQLRGKHERDAVKDWITEKDSDRAILDELPKLAVGEAIVDSPQWLGTTVRVRVYEKRTADVSATPKVGEKPAHERPLTAVDIAQVREAMAATIEKVKADDPDELRKQIAALKKERDQITRGAADATTGRAILATIEQAEAPLRARIDGLKRQRDALVSALSRLHEAIARAARETDRARDDAAMLLKQAKETVEDSRGDVQLGNHAKGTGANRPSTSTGGQQSRSTTRPPVNHTATTQRAVRADVAGVSAGAQKLLDAAAKLASVNIDTPTRTQVAALAPMSPTSSATERYFAEAIKAGYFDTPVTGAVRLSDAGRAVAMTVEAPPTFAEYFAEWQRLLGIGAERKLYDAMVERMAHKPITRAELAELAGISSTSSATERGFAWLIGLDLLQKAGAGEVKPGPTMFPEGLL